MNAKNKYEIINYQVYQINSRCVSPKRCLSFFFFISHDSCLCSLYAFARSLAIYVNGAQRVCRKPSTLKSPEEHASTFFIAKEMYLFRNHRTSP